MCSMNDKLVVITFECQKFINSTNVKFHQFSIVDER